MKNHHPLGIPHDYGKPQIVSPAMPRLFEGRSFHQAPLLFLRFLRWTIGRIA